MTMDPRFTIGCVEDEMSQFARAFATGNERAMDHAEADFDNLIVWLDEIQQGDGPEAALASHGIEQANALRQTFLDSLAEA